MNKFTKGGAAVTLLVGLVGGFEGVRTTAYPDPATGGKPWTVCYGETDGVKPNDRYTLEQCRAMLRESLVKYADGIDNCVKVPLPDKRWVALVSFSYNVGIARACGSNVVKLINMGRTRDGCNALLRWNRAAGIVFPGLTKRRQRERDLCMEGA